MGTISGSEDPNNRALGPKYHKINGAFGPSNPIIWVLGPFCNAIPS